jgi:hypothetical protein
LLGLARIDGALRLLIDIDVVLDHREHDQLAAVAG